MDGIKLNSNGFGRIGGTMLAALLCVSCAAAPMSPASSEMPVQDGKKNDTTKAAATVYHQHPTEPEELLQAMNTEICPDCKGTLRAVLQSSVEDSSEEKCISYPHGTDDVTKAKITYVLHCDACNKDAGTTRETTVVQSNICHGWS